MRLRRLLLKLQVRALRLTCMLFVMFTSGSGFSLVNQLRTQRLARCQLGQQLSDAFLELSS